MIKFKPARKVSDSMPAMERARTAALLNVRAEPGADNTTRFLLDVAFQAVPVKRPLSRGHWYVACRGAMINLQTLDGTIIGRTAETPMEFAYKNETSSGGKPVSR